MSDLIERITRARKEKHESESIRQEAAVRRGKAVEENSVFVWKEIIGAAKALVSEYNKTFPAAAPVTISERPGAPPQGFDVNRPLFPMAKLSVWRDTPHFCEFFLLRLDASFDQEETTKGRIDIRADDDRNVYFSILGEPFATAGQLAEHLMGMVLS